MRIVTLYTVRFSCQENRMAMSKLKIIKVLVALPRLRETGKKSYVKFLRKFLCSYNLIAKKNSNNDC